MESHKRCVREIETDREKLYKTQKPLGCSLVTNNFKIAEWQKLKLFIISLLIIEKEFLSIMKKELQKIFKRIKSSLVKFHDYDI